MSGNKHSNGNCDLLGDPDLGFPSSAADRELFTPSVATPGKTVDLSGASGIYAGGPQASAASFGPDASCSQRSTGGYGGGGNSFGSASSNHYTNGNMGGPGGFGSRGPTSFEGNAGGSGLSLAGLTPANIMRQLASRPVSELVVDNGRELLNIPRYAARAYTAAARRYLRPWNEFLRIRPGRIIEGLRGAQRRGEIQVHLQRNVLANARNFCPNYAFVFLSMLFFFVCTSPMLLCMLGAVGGGWSHALRSDQFRNRPWTLQIGGVQVPLGSNMKMLIMSLPTLLFLHFFMGPVLWSAALCSGGVSLAHAALRDRDDDADTDDHGLGPSSVRIRELP